MAGHPGTPRFGEYPDEHYEKVGDDGQNDLRGQTDDDTFHEQHFLYNPAQRSREMGTTLGEAPGNVYQHDEQTYCAPANHDGFSGGDWHLTSIDERKTLDATIYNVPVVFADDFQRNFDSTERTN